MITITINTDSEAFEYGRKMELNDMLQGIIDFDCYSLKELDGYKLRDTNGNTVGEVKVNE